MDLAAKCRRGVNNVNNDSIANDNTFGGNHWLAHACALDTCLHCGDNDAAGPARVQGRSALLQRNGEAGVHRCVTLPRRAEGLPANMRPVHGAGANVDHAAPRHHNGDHGGGAGAGRGGLHR